MDANAAENGNLFPPQGRRVPSAPVRTAPEVMADPHMHERGMLVDIEHPELGPITVPTSALAAARLGLAPAAASPKVGQHKRRNLRRLARAFGSRACRVEGRGVI